MSIRAVDIQVHYSVKPVLSQLTFEIPAGTRTAIIGPNGVGKTSLLNVLAGVHTPQSGFVEIDGKQRRRSVDEELAIRRQTVFLPDHCYLPRLRTGREFLMAVGQLYQRPAERLFEHVDRLLRLFQLLSLADAPLRAYSAGQQKKIALASALVTDASTYLLDEPFSGGLDPAGILALQEVLRRLAGEQGKTIVLTSPVPELVTEVADRVMVLRDGTIIAQGTWQELEESLDYHGTRQAMLRDVVFPETMQHIDAYFQSTQT